MRTLPSLRKIAGFALLVTSIGMALATSTGKASPQQAPPGPTAQLTFTWGAGTRIQRHDAYQSCSSAQLCMLETDQGRLYAWSDPLDTNRLRRLPSFATSRVFALACPLDNLCLASGRRGILASRHPLGGAPTYHGVGGPRGVGSIFCGTGGSFCVANGDTTFETSASPLQGTWARRSYFAPFDAQNQIYCSASATCISWGFHAVVITIQHPELRNNEWSKSVLPLRSSDRRVGAGACVENACLVGTDGGAILATSDAGEPSGTAWTRTDAIRGKIEGLTCPTTARCYASVYKHGDRHLRTFAYSNNPFDAAPVWNSVEMPLAPGEEGDALPACPDLNSCFFVFIKIDKRQHQTLYSRLVPARISPAD